MNRLVAGVSAAVVVALAATALSVTAQRVQSEETPTVAYAVRHDLSLPLRDLPGRPITPGASNRQVPIKKPARLRDRPDSRPTPDGNVAPPTTTLAPSPSLSFEGTSDDDNAAVLGFRIVPPDTNGDVGRNHYVQWNNLLYEVFDKSGNSILGPRAGNSLWTGFGGICEENNDGDPIVLYDHLADRWVVSQFAIGADGHQCVAVSATGDPTGTYHRYDFVVSPGDFNDYPKLGVWPDGYYLTANEFGASFNGMIAVVFERDQMLAGNPARMIKFGPFGQFFSALPSDLDGVAPPTGTPNTFIMSWDDETWGNGSGPDGYRLWNFSTNWTNPAASSFTQLPLASAPEFNANLCNFNACIRQPSPGERLDSLSQFTMFRAQYRNFGSFSTLVVNHTVDVNGRDRAGVRWAELRNSGSGWSVHQTGTYSPDATSRWLGGISMDRFGNIALGYSASSNSVRPSVRYVTRAAGDPLGTMGTEAILQAGAGSQQQSFNRWGDYSYMTVDPVDDCTFWYTNEYYANNGSFDFKTRIGAFKMPGC